MPGGVAGGAPKGGGGGGGGGAAGGWRRRSRGAGRGGPAPGAEARAWIDRGAASLTEHAPHPASAESRDGLMYFPAQLTAKGTYGPGGCVPPCPPRRTGGGGYTGRRGAGPSHGTRTASPRTSPRPSTPPA